MTEIHAAAGRRADSQRDRILCAALGCFIEHGFHAASMASIAERAQMSAGLIYRYFENKNAIVLGIVQRQLEEKRALIRQLQSSAQLVDGLAEAFEQWCRRDAAAVSVALLLEMSAEATRNAEIAQALHAADAAIRAAFEEWLCRPREQGGADMSAERARCCALEIRLVIDGLTVRAAREPGLDRLQLRRAIANLIQPLLEGVGST